MRFSSSCRRVQCVTWVVGLQYKLYACIRDRYATSEVCLLYMLVELAFTYQTIVALSAKLNHQSAYWMSSAYLHSIFIGALPQIKNYVEQVEKAFLWNEGGCRDVTSWKRRGTRRCLDRDRKSLITLSLHLCFSMVYTFTSVLKIAPPVPTNNRTAA